MDLISRQDAIDAIYERIKQIGYEHNHSILSILQAVREVPSVEPEIIYCGDCKYKDDGIDEDGIPFLKCLNGRSYGGTRINDYCSWAEKGEQMSRLIDADALWMDVIHAMDYCDDILEIIEQQPTVEPERRTGKWISKLHSNWGKWGIYVTICSECGFSGGAEKWNFCPNCGKKMEVKDE